jgi:peptidoglycan/xylan/chitin deacetylase (PgdA/CDA1 family)
VKQLILKTVICFVIGWLLIYPSIARTRENSLYSDQVAVLAYHHIDNEAKSDVTITSGLFEAQLRDLKDRGYHFISLEQFEAFLNGNAVPDNAILVTFDDGYESFYVYAYPILKKFGIPAVNFVITKDLQNPTASKIPSLSEEQIREMARDRISYRFQCHTDSLHGRTPDGAALFTSLIRIDGRLESEEEYKQRIIQDTGNCRRKLELLQDGPVDSLAYPFGMYTELSSRLVQKAGIRIAFTTINEMATRDVDPMQIPRINAGSPFVKAVSVNNLIIRRIVSHLPENRPVRVSKVLADIGGRWEAESGGIGKIEYGGHIIDLADSALSPESARTITAGELGKLLQVTIDFNPVTGKYIALQTPRKKEDE